MKKVDMDRLCEDNLSRMNEALSPDKLMARATDLRKRAAELLREAEGLEGLAYERAGYTGGGEPDQGASA